MVAKPCSIPSNSLVIPGPTWGGSDVRVDPSVLYLQKRGGAWWVISHDYVPGPGPGDFRNEWPTAQEAISDILDFCFVNPARIDAKRSQ